MTLRDWVLATRPRTLTAGVVPVVVGLALATRGGSLDWPVALLTLATAVLIQLTTNFANDYFDAQHGADGPDRLGPARVSQGDPVASAAMKRATIAAAGTAALLGLGLVAHGGAPILMIGVASLLAAVAYTGGPYPLAYHGWGDVFVFVFFGPVAVFGTMLLQGAPIDGAALRAACMVGALATAILVVNNLRDRVGDARVGKRTLAVRFGAQAMRLLHTVLVMGTLATAAIWGPWWALVALPLGVLESGRIWMRDGRLLNESLAGTARLHLVFGLLLAGGLVS